MANNLASKPREEHSNALACKEVALPPKERPSEGPPASFIYPG